MLIVLLPMLLHWQLLHWLGFLIDEIAFPGHRRVVVTEPLFVLGVPRSGTTFMHRLLAEDPRFTTFSTWECLFAPSITERYIWHGLARIDRVIGRPFGRLIAALEKRAFGQLEDIHPMGLRAPEEDYFVFLPLLTCFLLVVPFPEANWVWRMGRFDRDVDAGERRALMAWYHRCLQKHLYFHGSDRRMLSKNAAFAGMAHSLVETFPDFRVVMCERDAVQAITSQFKAIAGGLTFFGNAPDDPRFQDKLLECLEFYYQNLTLLSQRLGDGRVVRVALRDLSRQTRHVVDTIFSRFAWEPSDAIGSAVTEYEQRERPPRVGDSPPLSTWGMDVEEISVRFAPWRHQEAMRL